MKTRFCPSPTGLMHLGNTRTALFNALYARHTNGCFLLRIEDTDKQRSQLEFADALQEDLHWLGLDWQEGPGPEGGAAPYWQSQRQDIYDQFYQTLEDAKMAYPCFCSEAQLALARKVQRASGQPPRYPGTCRHLSAEEVAAKIAAGEQPTLRFRISDEETICFTDLVHGEQVFKGSDMGDFIIRRTDGTSPFMFCNAIDDALMGVTHVIRGADHLANSPRQIMILSALGLNIPQYAHISLITGPDGSPLSKRHGSRSVQALRDEGYLPLALLNYLARLGHTYENAQFMNFAELAEQFDLAHLSRSPARFDSDQLQHWQKEALARCSDEAIWTWMGALVHDLVPKDKIDVFVQAVRPNVVFPRDALTWAQRLFSDELAYDEEAMAILQAAGHDFFKVAERAVEAHGADNSAVCAALKNELNVKGKKLFQPLRIALTGVIHGPEMNPIFALLGAEVLEQRFGQAKQLCE